MTTKIAPTNDNRVLNESRLVSTSGTYTYGNAATTDIIRVGSSN